MTKTNKVQLLFTLCLLLAFLLWTWAVSTLDVQPIGPQGSQVGFAALNTFFHKLTGVHMALYTLSDWLSLVPLGIVLGFGGLGLAQWLRRGKLSAVDPDLFILGGFYLAVMAAFLAFEIFPVNYRPLLIQGKLEASYPSSTTLLALCVMPTARMQLRHRIRRPLLRKWVSILITILTGFMVIARLLSGVHWLTDIIGGILLSAALVQLYAFAQRLKSPLANA